MDSLIIKSHDLLRAIRYDASLRGDIQTSLRDYLNDLKVLFPNTDSYIWLAWDRIENSEFFCAAASVAATEKADLQIIKLNHYPELYQYFNDNQIYQGDNLFADKPANENDVHIYIPIIYNSAAIGILVVGRKGSSNYLPSEVAKLLVCYKHIARILDNSKLQDESQRYLRAISTFHEISVKISSRLDTQQALSGFVELAANLLNTKSSTIALCEPGTNLARIVALHNIPLDYEELILRPGASVASQVLVTGQPVIINDIGRFEREEAERFGPKKQKLKSLPYHSILSVPLIWNGELTGALSVMDNHNRIPFGDNDSQFLSLLANMLSATLNNSTLYSQVLQSNYSLEQKVEARTQEVKNAHQELAALHAATVNMQEEERARISRELHDSLNQLITGTLFELQTTQSQILSNQAAGAVAHLETAKTILRQMDTENRRIIAGLRPTILDTHGLVDAIKKMINQYSYIKKAKFHINTKGQLGRLEPLTEISVYRIVQESLKNAVSHARAKNIFVKIEIEPEQLLISIADDGIGFDSNHANAKERFGLVGMKERAQIIGGSVEISSQPGRGTQIMLTLPIHDDYEPHNGSSKPEKRQLRSQRTGLDRHGAQKNENYDPNLVAELSLAIENIDDDRALALLDKALGNSEISALEILNNGIMAGLKAIGNKVENDLYSIGELLLGEKLAENCLAVLTPHLPKRTNFKRGTIVIGAVQGDIHSMGYEMVGLLMKMSGFEVYSLGVNIPSETFVDKAIEYDADIIALSTLLVTTAPFCEEVIKNLEMRDVRSRFKVIIGGTATSQQLADVIGADGWSSDAFDAVRLCNRLIGSSE